MQKEDPINDHDGSNDAERIVLACEATYRSVKVWSRDAFAAAGFLQVRRGLKKLYLVSQR